MFLNLDLLYKIYQNYEDEKQATKFLQNIIKNEARLNNDILNVIRRSDPNKVAKDNPKLFTQLNTASFDLLSTLGKLPSEIFDTKKEPTYDDIEKLDKASNTYPFFRDKTEVELYEFYILKSKLLISLAESDSISTVNVILKSRINNLEYATRALFKKLRRR